ncbi:Linker histone H1/H5 protein [Dioscorea alata]|uniref:Linker histone H1/H5 protein n=1 Tax=Dioscorea alata TaxID=55571 RepID=A0ACB7WG38_DIOAL|nr:Linker histone H1/H5 protein [Dioscorea alata]
MAAAGETEPVAVPVADEQPEKKPRTSKAPKEKKPVEAAKPASPNHPPYFQMIKEAILALHGKEGSSSYAIAKYMEEKHKEELPGNFKKMLAVQLRSFAAKGKLLKVKASFKLPESEKKDNKDDHEEEMKVADQPKKEMKKKAVVSLKSEINKMVGVRKTRKAALVKAKQPKSIKKG